MDMATLGAALKRAKTQTEDYVSNHFKNGTNINIVDNPDGTQTINASGEVSSEDTVARAEIAAIKDGITIDSFADVESALNDKADTADVYNKSDVDTALSGKADTSDIPTTLAELTGDSAHRTVSDSEKTTWNGKQDTISDLSAIRIGAALGATAIQPETGKGLSTNDFTTSEKTKLDDLAEIKSIGTGLTLDSETGELTATGGGGGGGTSNYNDLSNKPSINGTTLAGNKSLADLGIQSELTFDNTPTADSTNPVTSDGVYKELGNKVDKVSGKGLSTNDYTTAEKTKLAGIAEGAEVNVQADWTQTTTTADDYIKNKPTLGTAAAANAIDFATAAQGTKADNAIPTTEKGAANGVAELDSNGLVPSSQLPSYVDDVLEYSSQSAFPATGQTGKIYIAQDTNKTFRWSGSAYVEISASLALGTTSSTAYRGDRGQTAYTHATDSSRLTTAKSSGLYKIATTSEGHVASATAVTKSDITALGIPAQDTTYESKSASSGGTAVSLVTTGEKYTWNNKQSALSSAQLAAVNSGITSTDVAQITDNKNNILSKAIAGICNSSSSTSAKVVTIDNFVLQKGCIIGVKFSENNTASSVTLNVSNTGAKSIYYNNAVYNGNSYHICGKKNTYTYYMYDGTYWCWVATAVNTTPAHLVTTENATSINITGIDKTYNTNCIIMCTDRRTSNAQDSVYFVSRYNDTVRLFTLSGNTNASASLSNDIITISGLLTYQTITVLAAESVGIAVTE